MRIGESVVIAVALMSCSGSPTQPSCPCCAIATPTDVVRSRDSVRARGDLSPVANYAGIWNGQYHVTGCIRTCGSGPNVCRFFIVPPGASFPLRITLVQDGANVSGTVDLFNNTGRIVVETGQIHGDVDDANTLTLSAITITTDPSEPSQSTLSGWTSMLAGDGNSMTGRFTRAQAFQNFWGKQQTKMDCELVDFKRSSS